MHVSFFEVAFLLQDGVACSPSREEKVMFLLMLPLDKMVLSPCHFCDGKGFSMVQWLQTELLALKEHINIMGYVNCKICIPN